MEDGSPERIQTEGKDLTYVMIKFGFYSKPRLSSSPSSLKSPGPVRFVEKDRLGDPERGGVTLPGILGKMKVSSPRKPVVLHGHMASTLVK